MVPKMSPTLTKQRDLNIINVLDKTKIMIVLMHSSFVILPKVPFFFLTS